MWAAIDGSGPASPGGSPLAVLGGREGGFGRGRRAERCSSSAAPPHTPPPPARGAARGVMATLIPPADPLAPGRAALDAGDLDVAAACAAAALEAGEDYDAHM